MKSAFEKWVESKYGESVKLIFKPDIMAAWNAAVAECHDVVLEHSRDNEPDVYEICSELEILDTNFVPPANEKHGADELP